MQNIQDLQDKIFSESKNIIDILGGINNVDELISKHDLIADLAEKTSFLKLLNKNLERYQNDDSSFAENALVAEDPVTEEEAIFNNELNEIGEDFENEIAEIPVENQEEIFNHQIEEIIESDFHESMVNLAEESQPEANVYFVSDEITDHLELEEEAAFNNQLNEIDEEETEHQDQVLSFVDEERILEDSEPEDDDFEEEIFAQNETEEEKVFENQMDEVSQEDEKASTQEIIPNIFEPEHDEDDLLIEETENEYVSNDFNRNQDELITENSNVESILTEIKHENEPDPEPEMQEVKAETSFEEKVQEEISTEIEETDKELKSDQSFENLENYRQEKKIKLAHIRGLKNIQTLFDDDPLEREIPEIKEEISESDKEDHGSLLKSNVPTGYMEAEKARPEFRLDLNDRLAFTKILFGGSQSDLNNAMTELNNCRNLEEAKEYLSDLYYAKKWEKVDEYAQRLWILVENKFA